MYHKLIVYTAIFGGKDRLIEAQIKHPDLKYICFTDDPNLKSNTWDVRLQQVNYEMDPVRNAKIFKVLPHSFLEISDISLWIDGTIQLKKNPLELADKILGKYAVSEPPLNKKKLCLYHEAEICMQLQKDNPYKIYRQIKRYQFENYPKDNGLWRCGVLFRKHFDIDVISFNELWWEEIKNYSRRDQISFPYIVNKTKLEISTITNTMYNEYFNKRSHNGYCINYYNEGDKQ